MGKEVEQIMVKESEDAKEKETKKGCWARINSELGVDTFPRLELAIKMEQKEFIAHPYFQKKVQEMYDPTETGCVKSLLTTLLQLLLSPFIAVYLSIFLKYDWSVRKRQVREETKEETKEEKEKEKEKEKEEEGIMGRWQNQIKSPKFAAQRYFALYAVFVALLVTEAMKPTKNNKRNMTEFCRQIDAVEVLILIFVLGYLKHIGTLIHHNGWKFFHYIFNNLYLVTMGLVFSAYVVWGIGYWQVKHADLCDDPKLMSRRYQWNENTTHIVVSEIMFMLATILAFFKLLEVGRLFRNFGIMQYILFKTFVDVLYVLFMFVLIAFSVTVGLYMIYFNYQGDDNWDVKLDSLSGLPRCRGMNAEFYVPYKTHRVLLWGLFGYGGPEYSLIYTPNIRYNSTDTLLEADMMEKMKAKICTNVLKQEEWDALSDKYDLKKEFQYEMSATEFFGYLVFFVYHFVTIVLLMNLLIAKMSQTYADIFQNADMEWKYQRTMFLTRFMDHSEILTPPFNLLPRLNYWARLIFCTQSMLKADLLMTEEEKEKYHELEDKLHHRLNNRPLERRSETTEVLDLSKAMVQDTNWMLTIMREKRHKDIKENNNN